MPDNLIIICVGKERQEKTRRFDEGKRRFY